MRARTVEEYRQVLMSSLEEYERLSRMIENILLLARSKKTENKHVAAQNIEAPARAKGLTEKNSVIYRLDRYRSSGVFPEDLSWMLRVTILRKHKNGIILTTGTAALNG
jgi:hypothetical protein